MLNALVRDADASEDEQIEKRERDIHGGDSAMNEPGDLQGGEYAGQINRETEHPLSTLEQEILQLS